jgi:hypothetical protein
MRSAGGYLNSLVQSARPVSRAGVHAARRVDWGPTRSPGAVDEIEAPQNLSPEPATRSTSRPTRPAAAAAPAAQQPSAVEAPTVATAEPVYPAPASPLVVTRVESTTTRVPDVAPQTAAPARETPAHPPRRTVEAPATPRPLLAPAPPRQAAPMPMPMPRLPSGIQAALDRLEHLARQFSSALPVEAERPPVPADPPRHDDSTTERVRDHGTVPRPMPRTLAPTLAPAAPTPKRVEIGSIEVFVAQPPAPPLAQVAASAAAERVAAAAPAGPKRLSRPLHPYGFGQG